MTTVSKKTIVAIMSAMVLAMSLMATPVSAKSLYGDHKYYQDGYTTDGGQFRSYDYDYYHKDGERSDSYYGNYSNYNNAYSNYRYTRDRANYRGASNGNYNNYYSNYDSGNYNNYGTNYNYGNNHNYKDNTYTNSYNPNSNVNRTGAYDYRYDGYNNGCSYYDQECAFHKDRDRDGDYNYVQVDKDSYVRSDYFNDYYAAARSRYMDSFRYRY